MVISLFRNSTIIYILLKWMSSVSQRYPRRNEGRLSQENSKYKEITKNANVTKGENAWRSQSQDRSRLIKSKTWETATRLQTPEFLSLTPGPGSGRGHEVGFQATGSEQLEESLSYMTIFLFLLTYLFSPSSCRLLLCQTEMPTVIWHYQ